MVRRDTLDFRVFYLVPRRSCLTDEKRRLYMSRRLLGDHICRNGVCDSAAM
jgi:hypothetical protein